MAALVTLVAALATGVPTGIVPTGLFTRMTPVLWWNYPVWAASAILAGLVAATYVRSAAHTRASDGARRTVGSSIVTLFAIGCPVCNKLVVAAIGVSGALSLWAPLQPVLGVLSIAVLVSGLAVRLRGEAACAVRHPPGMAGPGHDGQ